MKITRRQLRQIIKEEAQARDWTSFDDAKMVSLESTSVEPVYWYNPKDSLVHKIVNGRVAGDSPKVVHGSRKFLAYKRKAKENPGAYFNFTAEEETLAEGYKMKITRRQLRQIIKEELSRLDESMSVDTMEALENAVKSGNREELNRVLRVAYEEGMRSYSPDQRVIGIPGKTDDRPVDSDPHTEVVNTLAALVKSIQDDTGSDRVEKLDPDLLKGAYVSSKEDREAMKDYIAKLKAKKKSMDSDGDGALSPGELHQLADELEGEGQDPPKSFSVPYRSSGYQGRRIISRDRAWLEFVPKGDPPRTPEDMFREVTLLKNWDPEIQKALDAADHDLSRGDIDLYDVYSVYATTTG